MLLWMEILLVLAVDTLFSSPDSFCAQQIALVDSLREGTSGLARHPSFALGEEKQIRKKCSFRLIGGVFRACTFRHIRRVSLKARRK